MSINSWLCFQDQVTCMTSVKCKISLPKNLLSVQSSELPLLAKNKFKILTRKDMLELIILNQPIVHSCRSSGLPENCAQFKLDRISNPIPNLTGTDSTKKDGPFLGSDCVFHAFKGTPFCQQKKNWNVVS